MTFCTRALLLLSLLALSLFPAGAVDDDEYNARRGIRDRGNISVGGFLVSFDTLARLDSEELGQGTGLNFEQDLNLETSTTDLRLDGYIRFKRKHRLEFAYMLFNRGATVTLDEPIQFGDEIFDVDATVAGEFNTRVAKLAYKYSIVNNGKIEAGISAGLSILDLETSLAASGTVGNGGGTTGAAERAEESFIAPVPVLGAHLNVTMHPNWFFRASWEYFDAGAQDIDARLIDAKVTFDYYPWNHVGFGLGYNLVNIDYSDREPPAVGVDYDYDGALAYVSFIF